MKLIWKIKRILLHIEDRLKFHQFWEGFISYKEYCEWESISRDRWFDIVEQGKQNGWYYDKR